MKRQALIGLCFFVLSGMLSCGNKDQVPAHVIGMKEMSKILLDMQEAEVYNESYVDTSYRMDDREKRLKTFYGQILLIHGVSKDKFLSSFSFYEARPDLMDKMYADMQQEVDRKKAHADSIGNLQALRLSAARRREELIKYFNSFRLPFQRYQDSIPTPKSLSVRPGK